MTPVSDGPPVFAVDVEQRAEDLDVSGDRDVTDVSAPVSIVRLVLVCLIGAPAIASTGLSLGTILPTVRAAQSVGLLLWFVAMFVSGAGPPPEVLPSSLQTLGDWFPLTPIVELLQGPWLSGDWAAVQSIVAVSIAAVSGFAAWLAFRWE